MNFSGTLRVNKFACFTVAFILFLIVYWRSGNTEYPTEKDWINLKDLLKASIRAAERGGQMVTDGTRNALNVKSKGKTKEGANDPVTDADYASHCAMYYGFKKTFATINVVSEEHSNDDSTCEDQQPFDTETAPSEHQYIEYLNNEYELVKDVTVWIDPLDATQEYTEALYEYVTTMVCVAVKGVPVIGVIHHPFPPRTYWGWVTKQPSKNIHSSPYKEENKNHPSVIVSRSHPGQVGELAKRAFGDETVVTPAAGAGYKVMTVVNGTQDLYLHSTHIKKWDLCAGDAIIKTVGGRMTTTKDKLISYSPTSDVTVSDGVVVARYDHDYYLSKLSRVMSKP